MATFAYDDRSSVEASGALLVLRFNGGAAASIVDVEAPVRVGSGALTVTVNAGASAATLSRIVDSGYGPFFAEYTLGTPATQGQTVTASATASLFVDDAGNATPAFTDSNVNNDVRQADEPTLATLCTATQVKAYLGITVSTYDTELARLARAATLRIERYCGRKFTRQARIEIIDGMGSDGIVLEATPIRRIAAVYTVDGDGTPEYVDPDDYRSNRNTGELRLVPSSVAPHKPIWGSRAGAEFGVEPSFPDDFQSVIVDYTGGWTTIPEDLEQACIELIKHMFQSRSRDEALQSETTEGYSYTNASGVDGSHSGIPGYISGALASFRRVSL